MTPVLRVALRLGVAIGLLGWPLAAGPPAPAAEAGPRAAGHLDVVGKRGGRIRRQLLGGGRLDWEPGGRQRVAMDRRGQDGYYDVYVMPANASEMSCLTCGSDRVPQLNNGQPAWHPSGLYLIFQAQDPALGILGKLGRAGRRLSNPGAGVHNNVWIMTEDGRQAWPLTQVRATMGVLHPHVSRDGTRLVWAERVGRGRGGIGQWAIKLATLALHETPPRLTDVRQLTPGGMTFFETHGFMADDRSILFTGCVARKPKDYYRADIYRLDLDDGVLTRLTGPDERIWDEHAHASPDGRRIVWMSSAGVPQHGARPGIPRTDYWLMNVDGSGKERITYFNEPGTPEHIPGGVTAADVAWSPDGSQLLAYLILHGGSEQTVFISLERQ
jgi:Tol biopolymer transport system component